MEGKEEGGGEVEEIKNGKVDTLYLGKNLGRGFAHEKERKKKKEDNFTFPRSLPSTDSTRKFVLLVTLYIPPPPVCLFSSRANYRNRRRR